MQKFFISPVRNQRLMSFLLFGLLGFSLKIFFQWSKELRLLLQSLELTMTEGGGSIDKLEGDLFLGGTVGDRSERLSEGDHSFLDTRTASSDHDVVLVDNSVVGISSHWGDLLGSEIVLSLDISLFADNVDLLVDFRSVMVSVLTSSGNAVSDSRWMPSSNTGNLTETLVSLSGQSSSSPTGGDTFVTLTLGGSKSIDQLVVAKYRVNGNLLFKKGLGELDLIGSLTTVDLDLHNVSSLLS